MSITIDEFLSPQEKADLECKLLITCFKLAVEFQRAWVEWRKNTLGGINTPSSRLINVSRVMFNKKTIRLKISKYAFNAVTVGFYGHATKEFNSPYECGVLNIQFETVDPDKLTYYIPQYFFVGYPPEPPKILEAVADKFDLNSKEKINKLIDKIYTKIIEII